MKRIVVPLMGLFAIAGLADSVYLVLKHFGILRDAPFMVASACELGGGPCQIAIQPDVGGILGIPPPVLGGLYFGAIVLIVIVRLHLGRWLFPYVTLAFLVAGMVYSGYLLYLIAALDQPCPYCLAAHSINVAVLGLFVVSLLLDRADRRRAAWSAR